MLARRGFEEIQNGKARSYLFLHGELVQSTQQFFIDRAGILLALLTDYLGIGKRFPKNASGDLCIIEPDFS
jgi:hypothetical protein